MRGYLGLSCPPIDGGTQQPTKSRLCLLGGALERRRGWVGTCGEDGCFSFEKSNGATKNKEMGGPLAFHGHHLMRGHNNQIQVSVNVGGVLSLRAGRRIEEE